MVGLSIVIKINVYANIAKRDKKGLYEKNILYYLAKYTGIFLFYFFYNWNYNFMDKRRY